MADERARPSHQKFHFSRDSEDQIDNVCDSDDSIKDKDYCESGSSDSSTISEEEEVRTNLLWHISFF